MKVMLDTNTCMAIIRRRSPQVLQRFSDYSIGEVGISWATLAELEFGVSKSQHAAQNKAALEEFLLPLEVASFDREAAVVYGQVRAALERRGTPIGSMDTMIAAHALTLGVTLVTNNLREFSRVPGLKVVDWLAKAR
jgi:tRNA(fMet)-specific endonuclease VapC